MKLLLRVLLLLACCWVDTTRASPSTLRAAVVNNADIPQYTPTHVTVDNEGIVYLLSSEHSTVFRWSHLHEHLNPIPLAHYGAQFLSLTPDNTRLYIAYEMGKITYLDLTDDDDDIPKETELGRIRHNSGVLGLATVGNKYLFTTGDTTHYIFDAAGNKTVYEEFPESPCVDGYCCPQYKHWYEYNNNQQEEGDGYMYWAVSSAIYRRAINVETGLVVPCDWMQSRWWVDSEWEGSERIRLSPSGSYALLQTGEVLDVTLRESIARVPVRATDMVWLDDDDDSFVTISEESSQGRTLLQHWNGLTNLYNELHYEGVPLNVFRVAKQVIVVTQVESKPTFHTYIGSGDGDGDGVPMPLDQFPNDPAAALDTDKDGFPNKWNEGYTEKDSTTNLVLDAFPVDSACQYSHQAIEEGGGCNIGLALPPCIPDSFAVDEDGGIVYMLGSEDNRVFRWSATARTDLNPIAIGEGSKLMTLSEDGSVLFLVYETGAVTKLNVGSELSYPEETLVFTLPGMPFAAQAFAEEFLFVVDSRAALVLSKDGTVVDKDDEDGRHRIDGLVWSSVNRRMYQYSSHYGASGGIEYYNLDPLSGAILARPHESDMESPPFPDEDETCSTYSPVSASKCVRESPDGSLVALCEDSRVYEATSPDFCYTGHELVGSNPLLTDVLWLPDGILTQRDLREETYIEYIRRSDYNAANEYILEGQPLRLLLVGGKVLVATLVNGKPRFTEIVPSLVREVPIEVKYDFGVREDMPEESFISYFVTAMDLLVPTLVQETYTDDVLEDAHVEGGIEVRLPSSVSKIEYMAEEYCPRVFGEEMKICGSITHRVFLLVVSPMPGYLDWRMENALVAALEHGRFQTADDSLTLVLTALPSESIVHKPQPLDPCSCPLNQWEGTCGFFQKKSERWCGDYCCSEGEEDCCDIKIGVVTGVPIAGLTLISIIVVTSCYFCSCCCCYDRLHGGVHNPLEEEPPWANSQFRVATITPAAPVEEKNAIVVEGDGAIDSPE